MTAATAREEVEDRKFPRFSLLVCLLCIAGALALLYPPVRGHFDKLEYWTADWRTALLADHVPGTHPRIVLVLFDPATFDGGVISPIPRDIHAQLLRTLAAMHPLVLGLDFYFVASQGAEKDGAMLSALHDIETPIVLGAIDQYTAEFSPRQEAYQKDFLAQARLPAGYLTLRYDPGHIVRRTSPPLAGSPFQESFARQIALAAKAKLEGPGTSSESTRIAWLRGAHFDTEPFFRISAGELLSDADETRREEIERRIKGNIVITGVDMPNSDRHDTALSVWTEAKMLGVMIHAHILAQLLDGRYFSELDGRQRLALFVGVALVGIGLGLAVRGRRASFLNLGVATTILVVVDALCYSLLRLVLPFTLTLYVWFLAVLFGQHLQLLARWLFNPSPARQASTA
jgi:adenylate cyclase